MKYIKFFKEELKSNTYRRAAYVLRNKHGHHTRANNLDKWADDLDEKNFRKSLEENREKYKINGVFSGALTSYSRDTIFTINGNFYLDIVFEDYWCYNSVYDFWNGNNTFEESIPLIFYLVVISADDDTQDKINKLRIGDYDKSDILFTNRLELAFINNRKGDQKIFNPDGVIRYYSNIDYGDDFGFNFLDRTNSLKFKKLFFNLLSTGHIKNKLISFLKRLDDDSIPIGEKDYQKIVDSTKLISLNTLYRESII